MGVRSDQLSGSVLKTVAKQSLQIHTGIGVHIWSENDRQLPPSVEIGRRQSPMLKVALRSVDCHRQCCVVSTWRLTGPTSQNEMRRMFRAPILVSPFTICRPSCPIRYFASR